MPADLCPYCGHSMWRHECRPVFGRYCTVPVSHTAVACGCIAFRVQGEGDNAR